MGQQYKDLYGRHAAVLNVVLRAAYCVPRNDAERGTKNAELI